MIRYTSVEVCTGAGGQALGLEDAGFDHLACVEIDSAACQTLRHNRPTWNIIEADLREWDPDDSLRGVDLLAGGVPCPPFSIAGRQLGRDDDRDLFPEVVRLVSQLRPRAIMIENVRGLLGRKFDDYRDEIVRELKELGYEFCGWEVLNAAEFGVPQARQRSILVAMVPDAAVHFRWPEPVKERATVGQTLKPFMEALGWEEAEDWAARAEGVGPALVGGSKKHGGADLGPTRAKRAWRALGVDAMGVADSAPLPGTKSMPRLTVEMAAALQGFPASWIFQGRKTAAYRQVGNAFPPPVAAAVGWSIRAALVEADAAPARRDRGVNDESLIRESRDAYHAGLIASGTLTVSPSGVASMADGGNRLSVAVAADVARALEVSTAEERAAGQTLGGTFETATCSYLEATFPALRALRPGRWKIQKIGNRGLAIAAFEPYSHLAKLDELISKNPNLAAVLGNGYAISPDIVITRDPEPDEAINIDDYLVDSETALHTAIRAANQTLPILHAVISCKWTLRSDRAQNARSEALNLIRNRKGRLPHIVVVTAEPTPSRLSSLALGTGDIDCVYHIALPELREAVGVHGNDDNVEALETMIEGRRLKDVSDLPLDLAI